MLTWCLAVFVTLLLVLYPTVSDRTAWGEYLTIWPPVLWLVPAAALAVPLLWRGARWPRIALASTVFLFSIALIEWRSLLRFGDSTRPEGAIRVVTWNIGGGYESPAALLKALAEHVPDLVLLQESSGGFASEELSGPWDGWQWVDGGDCGVLSRWPARVLNSERIGPWDLPLILRVELPGRPPLLVVNVRLMLPSLRLMPLSSRDHADMAAANRERVAQYAKLAALIQRHLAEGDYGGVILGGDMNVDASARSLHPIRAIARDVWPDAGRGWGGTATRQFPVARIDHVYLGTGLTAATARVLRNDLSDHRPLMVDVVSER